MALTKVDPKATTTISSGWDAFNNLIDALVSVANAKGASQVGIQDSAANMDAVNVEDALAEIYIDHASTRTLAEILDENPATTTGLTWGYKAGAIRDGATVTNVTAGTVSLTNSAVNYVEVNSAGTISRNTTSFTSGRIPLRQVTCAGGIQTVSTDKRAWFAFVNLTDDSSPQLAGFLDTNGNYIEMEKGGDLTAANPLVIDTDGDYFDVAGNTNFASMTVTANRHFFLQFDGTPTMTHHATNLDLPGEANITAATGDVGEFFSTAANQVQCVSFTKADGTPVVPTSNFQDGTIQRANFLDTGTVTNAIGAIGGGAQTIDLALGNSVTATVDTAETTFTFSNPTAADEECGFVLYLTNGGSQIVNWPASVDWREGDEAELIAAGVDILVFTTVDGGTIWNGFLAARDIKSP